MSSFFYLSSQVRFKIASSHFALNETKAAIAEVCLLSSSLGVSSVCLVIKIYLVFWICWSTNIGT